MNKTKFKTFVERVNLYKEGDNPIFGNSVISVTVSDEGGGPYLIVEQCNDNHHGKILLDFDEIQPLFDLLIKMKKDCDYE